LGKWYFWLIFSSD